MSLFWKDPGDKPHLQIILTKGTEGPVRSLVITGIGLRLTVNLVLASVITLVVLSVAGAGFFLRGVALKQKVIDLTQQLHAVQSANSMLEQQVAEQTGQQSAQREGAIDEAAARLKEKTSQLESFLKSVGVRVKEDSGGRNAGGPFTSASKHNQGELVGKVDRYLQAARTIPLGLPLAGEISSGFGQRPDPINSRPAFHAGVDIRGDLGAKVKATANGTVYEIGEDAGYGKYVILDHGNGYRTVFGHLRKILVKDDEKIKRGQPVGLLGNSGRSTGPHVHYEVRYAGRPVNPAKFINISKAVALANPRTAGSKHQSARFISPRG